MWLVGFCLQREQRIDLGRADEVVFRQAADGMRGVADGALAPADGEVGVVVLAMRDPGRGVHEGHGLVIVLEFVGLADDAAFALPARQRRQHGGGFGVGQRRHAAFAGLALAFRQVANLVHWGSVQSGFGRAMRWLAGGWESWNSECIGSGVRVANRIKVPVIQRLPVHVRSVQCSAGWFAAL